MSVSGGVSFQKRRFGWRKNFQNDCSVLQCRLAFLAINPFTLWSPCSLPLQQKNARSPRPLSSPHNKTPPPRNQNVFNVCDCSVLGARRKAFAEKNTSTSFNLHRDDGDLFIYLGIERIYTYFNVSYTRIHYYYLSTHIYTYILHIYVYIYIIYITYIIYIIHYIYYIYITYIYFIYTYIHTYYTKYDLDNAF